MSDQIPFVWENTGSLPADHAIPGAQEIMLQMVTATFDGTSAASSFLPCLQVIGPSGLIVGTFVDQNNAIASGTVVECTFGPFLRGVTSSTTVTVGGLWGLPAWQTGCYYTPQVHTMAASAFSGAANFLMVYPIWIPGGSITQSIVTHITSTGGQIRMGVYADSGSGYPKSLVFDTGSQTPGAIGDFAVPFAHTFTAGLYWLAFFCNNNSLGTWSYLGSLQTVAATATLADYITGQSVSNYADSLAFAALPDPYPAGVHPHTFGAGFFVALRAA